MEYAVPKHMGCFLRQINVSTEERVVETDFPGFPVWHFLICFIQQPDADILKHRFTDRGNVILPVYLKLCNVEPGFTHAVIVDEPYALKPHAICRLTAGYQRLQAGSHALRHDPQDGRRQKRQVYLMPVELFIQLHGVTHRFCGQDNHVHAGIQGVEEDFYRCDEVERGSLGHTGGFVDQVTRMPLQGSLVQLDLAILL